MYFQKMQKDTIMKDKKTVCIIPARYGSSRLPGKPLLEISGKAMIIHVYERAQMISGIDSVAVATDDERIKECVEAAGGLAIMTSRKHPSGTDRIAEAARKMDLGKEDIVVNVQGDQPLLDPIHVLAIIKRLQERSDLAMTTPACPLDIADRKNPNRVKVVVDRRWNALYFSRSLIPYDRDGIWEGSKSSEKTPKKALARNVTLSLSKGDTPLVRQAHHDNPSAQSFYLRHLGLYAYRNEFLQTFVNLKPGVLEEVEKLEQLRALENGYSIGVALVENAPLDVDTIEDLKKVRSMAAGKHNFF